MPYNYNKNFISNAQALRKNMTDEEKRLWYDFFKKLPITVNRQKNIGDYIVDFFISSKKTVIELDGSQHSMPEKRQEDKKRDAYLQGLGITVLRYENIDVTRRFNSVCEDILRHIGLSAEVLKK